MFYNAERTWFRMPLCQVENTLEKYLQHSELNVVKPKLQELVDGSHAVNKKWEAMEQVRVPLCHDDVMTWKHFPYYWPFEMGSHRSLVHPRQKRPVMLRFNAFLVVNLNLLFNKRSSFQWFDTHMTLLVGIRARTKWTPSSRWYFQICILLK